MHGLPIRSFLMKVSSFIKQKWLHGMVLIFSLKNSVQKVNKLAAIFPIPTKKLRNVFFFANGDNPKVIGTIAFDSTFSVSAAITDGNDRDFTKYEHDLFSIRQKALSEINSDTLFKEYSNSRLNIIPFIYNNIKKVYVLTGPQKSGVVILGNDYLLTFDQQNNLTLKKQLHANIIEIKYTSERENDLTWHTHLPETGPNITVTDVCTILLYEKFAKWKQHIVLSDELVTLWDCKKPGAATMSRKMWDSIYNKSKEK
jgi:hypothetical protein